jgi:hypothetical protein
MMTLDCAARIKRLKQEVIDLGRNPKDYRYDLDTKNAYRIEHTKLGSYAYILINDKKQGREARVDLRDFYIKRVYSYRWIRMSSNPKKDYPHTNTWDSTGKLVNLMLHVLIMESEEGLVIDHNDGDHYNASRSNLNHVTLAQNNQNRHPRVKYGAAEAAASQYVSLFA